MLSAGIVDFVVFGFCSVVPLIFGAYYGSFNKYRTPDQQLLGNRKMPSIPVTISLMTTFLSGSVILGTPAEIFNRGPLYIVHYLSAVIGLFFARTFLIPTFFRINCTSVYEYLELRFRSSTLRKIGAAIFAVNTVVFGGIVNYGPAIAISGATGLDVNALIVFVGILSTTYTSLGGLRAVLWSDTFQAVIMVSGIGALIIGGLLTVDISATWDILSTSGRLSNMVRFDPSPTQFYSFWILLFGSSSMWLNIYGCNQMAVQRYSSLPTLADAKRAILMNIPCVLWTSLMCCLLGTMLLGQFYNCNPLETGEITSVDQLVIAFAAKVLGPIPGLTGLFLAAIFAAALSSVSSGHNSIAAVVYADFLKGYTGLPINPMIITCFVSLFAGILSTVIALMLGSMGGILYASSSLLGATNGPMTGLILLGVFFPKVSTRPATVSFVIANIVLGCCAFSNFMEKPYDGYTLPTNSSSDTCGQPFVPPADALSSSGHYGRLETSILARVSPWSYTFLGIFIVLVCGNVLSFFWKRDENKTGMGRRIAPEGEIELKEMSSSLP
ncbi:hypothetical protein QR680_000191 [Steinernema hermaphroditum]|uniref:Sodium/solute symporter n=1 Tax=Steinernema hermaphroditum TaxID=289476 RepID=A0AA39GTQ9_9BILA|nr:hypothetical protein QR680_000191 [Steinernema hermaphroditum]